MSVEKVVMEYGDMLFRVCMVLLCNEQDAQDAVQDTFCSYMEHAAGFRNREHEKAWLIRVAINSCKDHLKSLFRRRTVSLEELGEKEAFLPEHSQVLDAVLALPVKYKDAIYLHYYEGYSAAEIGRILGKKENTIYSLLSRGRAMLKKTLGGDL